MIVHFGVENIVAEWPSSTVVIGTFDGVHLGHRYLVERAVAMARERFQPCVIVTFDRHPLSVLAPDRVPPALGTLEQNVIALRTCGASAGVILAFDAVLSRTSATQFFDQILKQALKADQVVVGHDFAFGHQREGTPEWLSSRVETHVMDQFFVEGQRVSSSLIRDLISDGDVERAAVFLGRPFALAGVVIKGQQLGRTLGFPTVNLARASASVLPPDGVYAGYCKTPLGTFTAGISIGTRPAVQGTHRTIEAYLLDYPGESLYSAPIQMFFCKRLRGEENFPSLEALKEQMALDIQAVRDLNLQMD